MASAAAAASLPSWAYAAAPTNPDVVVIGAGAAGLAATRALLDAGHTVTLIEAANRIGGRAYTDTSIFGIPYDLGAHWLHQADDNPFVDYGSENGFTIYEAPEHIELYVGDRKASDEEAERYYGAYEAAIAAISRAGRAGRDVAPASVVPDGLEWNGLVHLAIGPYEMGKDFDHFSCTDWWNSNSGTDNYCAEGYGALLAHWARGIPVELSTRAQAIKWGGDGVDVETSNGTISAKACIVTVSTGVLASGELRFDPALPADKESAFHSLTMGLYNHIALQFEDNPFGAGEDGYVLYQVETQGNASPRGAGYLTNISGSGLTFADVGGGFARELEVEGADASIDFALSEARKMFGSAIDRSFVKGHATAWGRNQLTLGSYASAEPGGYPARATLRAPVADRIWFAGEACSVYEWATLAGAFKNGLTVADLVDRAL
jgi:monoamine oxidase